MKQAENAKPAKRTRKNESDHSRKLLEAVKYKASGEENQKNETEHSRKHFRNGQKEDFRLRELGNQAIS